MRTLPAICVHRCNVSQVSLHAASGRSGHIAPSLIRNARARLKESAASLQAECGTKPTSATLAKSGPKRLRLGKGTVGALRVLERVGDARFLAAERRPAAKAFLARTGRC